MVGYIIGLAFLLLGAYIIIVDVVYGHTLHLISAIVGILFILVSGSLLSLRTTQRVVNLVIRTARRAKEAEGDEPDVGSGPSKG